MQRRSPPWSYGFKDHRQRHFGELILTTAAHSRRHRLRKELRVARKKLTQTQQQRAKQQLYLQIRNKAFFTSAKRIAFYWPSDGEIDPRPLMRFAHGMGKQCFLPKLHPNGESRLLFSRWSPQQRHYLNRFAIAESAHRQIVKAGQLDLILLPLVGFNRQGHRLGMGGGFYDRSLEHLTPKQPRLVGVAHGCQQNEEIDQQYWDVALDFIAANGKLLKTSRTA